MGVSKPAELFWNFYQSADRLTGEEPEFLTPDERLRSASLRFEKRRMDWLGGRWAMKSLLVRSGILSSSVKKNCIRILNEDSGAPYAVDLYDVRLPGCISISHRAGAAFCAFSPAAGIQVGADLELVEAKEAAFFEDYFTPGEKSLALRCESMTRDLAIVLAWSGKEAVFKALGTGMRMDTRSVEIGGYEWIADHPITESTWYELSIMCQSLDGDFHGRWMLRGDYVLTLAYMGENEPLVIKEIPL
jgi:4'-phosphopantetheinyl transferase